MNDRTAVAAPSRSEALSTWALFLSMLAIIGFAMSVGTFGFERIGLTVTVGLVSLTSFVASMLFFRADAEDSADA